MIDPRDLIVLGRIPGVGPRRLRSLVEHFRGTEGITRASTRILSRVRGLNPMIAADIFRFFRGGAREEAVRRAEEQIDRLARIGGSIVTLWDGGYPRRLSEIYDPPPVLYVLGDPPGKELDGVAVVGTRRPTAYGVAVTEYFAGELCAAGITVVSGMARGIDTVAHRTAVRAGGRTVAVIGTGPDITYPPENRKLQEEIVRVGSVISEFPLETGPGAGNFPRRNRIISGLCHGTIVVESDRDGGAMITAGLALDQNREVFAVPGPARSARSRGCHALIRQGRATLAASVEDVLAELASHLAPGVAPRSDGDRSPSDALSADDRRILELLDDGPVHIDVISERMRADVPGLLVRLLTLELGGVVRQLPGKYFLRVV